MINQILMIGGTGRSGTTILKKIFSNHPDITNVPEMRFVIDPDGILDFYTIVDRWSPYHYDLQLKRLKILLKQISKRHPLNKLFLILEKVGVLNRFPLYIRPQYSTFQTINFSPEFEQFSDELLEKLSEFKHKSYWEGMVPWSKAEMTYNYFQDKKQLTNILSCFLRKVIQNVLNNQQARFYLEKNTWNILWFDKILDLLPEAKLVHIHRDPRDVVASYTKQSWMPSSPTQSAIIYRDIINHWTKIKSKIPANSFIEISLENLVSDQKQTLQQICDFWQVPWSNTLLDVDLSRSNQGRWKNDFNDYEQRQIQKILKDISTE